MWYVPSTRTPRFEASCDRTAASALRPADPTRDPDDANQFVVAREYCCNATKPRFDENRSGSVVTPFEPPSARRRRPRRGSRATATTRLTTGRRGRVTIALQSDLEGIYARARLVEEGMRRRSLIPDKAEQRGRERQRGDDGDDSTRIAPSARLRMTLFGTIIIPIATTTPFAD
jgi:hypothetical protein